jgi:hypothetical protein
LKLDGTYQFLFCAVDVNLLDININGARRKTDALLVASKEVSLKVNAK